MKRGKKIVLLSHCYLNVNSKIDGLAQSTGASVELVTSIMEKGYGIIQLPCIEQAVGGCRRWGQVYEQYDNPYYRKACQSMLQSIIEMLVDYTANGYEIVAAIGVNGSPTCGVEFTCSGSCSGEIGIEYGLMEKLNSIKTINRPGIMIEELQIFFRQKGLNIPFIGINEENPTKDLESILQKL